MNAKALTSTHILFALILILTLCLPVPAFAVSTVAAISSGNGVFLLQGIGIENAAALEIIVSYDTAALANPRVVTGPMIAGAMTAVNPNVPGTVRMVIIRLTPVSGAGTIATMTFDLKGSSPGSITSLTVRLADLKGSPIPSVTSIAAPAGDTPATTASSSGMDSPTSPSASTSPAYPGASVAPIVVPSPILIVPGSPSADTSGKPADSRAADQNIQQSVPAETVPAQRDQLAMMRSMDAPQKERYATKSDEKSVYRQRSILDRFRTYRGERTPTALIRLFDNESMIGCRQEPPIALSDGRSTVQFIFIAAPGTRTSSDIAVMGAKLLSLKKDPDNTNTWIVDLLPERGTYQASVAVPLGELRMIYPLTIAPKIDIKPGRGGTLTMADFERHLKEQAKDLDKNGKLDNIDDFIYTANYLTAVGFGTAHP